MVNFLNEIMEDLVIKIFLLAFKIVMS